MCIELADGPPAPGIHLPLRRARHRGENNGNASPGNISKLPILSLLYRGSQTRLHTRYMPWFGDSDPHDVGYRSDEPQQSARQVADMISPGLEGGIVDWYGPDSGLKNQSTIMLMKEAERQDNFEFAISEDADSTTPCRSPGAFAYLLLRLSALECLNVLADCMTYFALC